MSDLRFKISERGGRACSRCAPLTSNILDLKSNIRSALTLIELLVVIIILTTLVAGVIPILSPNNDTRKIREATRGLQTYITMAQAEAARSGRAQGIAFQESSLGSGVALEVFRLEVPPPFAGFSSSSRIRIEFVPTGATVYNPGAINTFKFHPQLNGYSLYKLTFELPSSTPPPPVFDPLPPRMFQVGDEINVQGNCFLIVDDMRHFVEAFPPSTTEYLDLSQNSDTTNYPNSVICIWLNDTGQVLSPGLKSYKIHRQPTNSAEAPYQLPASIAIDMQGSVAEGSSTGGFPTDISLFVPIPAQPNTVGIMFSPTGSVSSVYLNGAVLTGASRLALLLGRVENGGLSGTEWTIANGAPNDVLETKQEEINWLSLDSRWLSIAANSGRAVVTENAFVDARRFGALTAGEQAEEQIEAAHQFAHEMKTGGGG